MGARQPIDGHNKPTAEQIRQVLDYNPETGRFYRKNGNPAENVPNAQGYIRVNVLGKRYFAHRLAWTIHHGGWPDGFIDHINCDTSDNRICNLRVCSHTENLCNRGAAKHNTPGVKGVRWDVKRGLWLAQIAYKNKTYNLGRYADIGSAIEARQNAANRMHGDFVRHEYGAA